MSAKYSFLNRIIAVLVILTTLFNAAQPGLAVAQGNDGIQRWRNSVSNRVTLISGSGTAPIKDSGAMADGLSGQQRVETLLEKFAPEFGIKNPARDLVLSQETATGQGRTNSRYQQMYNGIPVVGGELMVNSGRWGELYSMSGEVSPGLSLDIIPQITANEASTSVGQLAAKWYGGKESDYQVTQPALWVFDENLLMPSTRPTELVWRMEVTASNESQPLRELVLVNAKTGGISLHFNQVDTSWNAALAKQDILPTETATPVETLPVTETTTPEPSPTPLPIENIVTTPDSTSVPINGSEDVVGLSGVNRYVSSASGSDSGDCSVSVTPCATINYAISQATAGDTVYVAAGTYTSASGDYVVTIDKNLTLLGGWNANFSSQDGYSVIDGQSTRGGIANNTAVTTMLDKFIVRNGMYYRGIYNRGNLTIQNSSINNNKYGGIHNYYYSNLSIINSTISNNYYYYYGGGVYNESGNVSILNSTISGNRAYGGAGISGASSIQNSIIAGNTVSSSFGPDCNGTLTSQGYNLIGITTNCTVISNTGDLLNVTANLGTFLPAVGYLPLLPSSPAIDSANPATCPATDQRGATRQGTCDIGAYEYLTPGPAAQLNMVSTASQHVSPGKEFTAFQVAVLDNLGSPVPGFSVTFTAPESGASGTFKDTGTNVSRALTDDSGVATAPTFTANAANGTYVVTASANGLTPAILNLENLTWYVAPSGNDANSCKTPTEPCANIGKAVYKAANGDRILVMSGTYDTALSSYDGYVVIINKGVSLSGGWNNSFTSQDGYVVVDGKKAKRGLQNISTAPVSIERFIIQNSSAEGIYTNGELEIKNTTIRWNSMGISQNGGFLTIRDSVVHNNIGSSNGAGISLSQGNASLVNVTVSNNTASGNGGGIAVYASNLTMTNVTVSNNTAASGGGIYHSSGSITIQNSLIAANTATSGPDCFGALSSQGNNLIGSTAGCTVTSVDGDKFNVAHGLGTFLSGLGYHPLMATSPAINAANPATCPSTDQRGTARNGICDIGAYEYVSPGLPSSLVIVSGSGQETSSGAVFARPLVAVVLDNMNIPVPGVNVTFSAPVSGPSITFASNGTNVVSVTTDGGGVATSPLMTANAQPGLYAVVATAGGLNQVNYNIENILWFVAPGGDDNNSCKVPTAPCATINAAIGKAANGNTLRVASGIYSSSTAVYINKKLTLSGGWNAGFTQQDGMSIVDGQGRSTGIYSTATSTVARFIVRNSMRGINNDANNYTTLTLLDSAVVNNTMGGIESQGNLILTNVTVSGNSYASSGGGVLIDSGDAVLTNTTIINNHSAQQGGGLFVGSSGKATLKNSIIAGNTASPEGPDCFNYGTITSAGYNLIGTTKNCAITAQIGDKFNIAAKFSSLLPEQGYHPLLSTSPAINTANPAWCPTKDQRGAARQGTCDMGAYEYTTPGAAARLAAYDSWPKSLTPGQVHVFKVIVLDVKGSPIPGINVTLTAPSSGSSGIFENTGSNTTSAVSDVNGIATFSAFTANAELGIYNLVASSAGLTPLNLAVQNLSWFVSQAGNDANSCQKPDAPCATIRAAMEKAADGDTIKISAETYTIGGVYGTPVVNLLKSLNLSGGWNAGFTSQDGYTIIDGGDNHIGVSVYGGVAGNPASVDRFVIQNGRFHASGAGIRNSGVLIVRNSAVIQNTGGGIWSDGDLTLINVTVSHNTVSYSSTGAGIFAYYGSLTVINSTITNNSSSYDGGGIYHFNNNPITIQNSIVAGNFAGQDGPNCKGKVISLGNNIIDSIQGCDIVAQAGDQFGVEPQLGTPLPGLWFYPLKPASPAINAANPAACPATDQRGAPRVGACDIGSFEYTLPGAATQLLISGGSGQRVAPNLAMLNSLNVVAIDKLGSPVPGVQVTFTAPESGPGGLFIDTGANTTTITTDINGKASARLKTNGEFGAYSVKASAGGVSAVTFSQENFAWYVSPTGLDANSCTSPATPCLTIQGAIGKALSGDTILVAQGTYTRDEYVYEVVKITKNLTFFGGWDASFTSQKGYVVVDGQNARRVITNSGTTSLLDHFMVQNGSNSGIYSNGNLTIQNSVVHHNRGTSQFTTASSYAGGIYTTGGTLVITNSTIHGNTTGELTYGAGITVDGGDAFLTNVTITGNIGNGIWARGKATLQNSILAENVSQLLNAPDCRGNIVSLGNNIVQSTLGCTVTAAQGDQFNVNPGLAPYIEVLGLHPLASDSPAINAANPAACPATDQRGVARNIPCDIGAYEHSAPGAASAMHPVQGNSMRIIPNSSSSSPLSVIVVDVYGNPVPGINVTFTAPESGPSGVFSASGTRTTQASSTLNGLASAGELVANDILGAYIVSATADGLQGVDFSLNNGGWMVIPASSGGNDASNCASPATACASIQGVMAKPNFRDGDPIWISVGEFGSASDTLAISISRPVAIYGGWNMDFTKQIGASIIYDSFRAGSDLEDITLDHLTIKNTNNTGIYSYFANLHIYNTTISYNTGGIYLSESSLEMVNSTISSNGALTGSNIQYALHFDHDYNTDAQVWIVNSTIVDNLKLNGAAIHNSATGTHPIHLRNSVVAKNKLSANISLDCEGYLALEGYNIIGHTEGLCILVSVTSTDRIGSGYYSNGQWISNTIDPGLGPLTDFGNGVWANSVPLGSLVIDNGGPSQPENGLNTCQVTDQRGLARPQGSACDIGAIEYQFNRADTLLLKTYSAQNTTDLGSQLICDQSDLSCAAAGSDQHAKMAHKFAAGTYQLYKTKYNRNSLDNQGIELLSSVHYRTGYDNAFWNGYMMIYGDAHGFALADDVVAHELTHGVTQNESNLFYYYQSGAINESLSDLWGEYYDQTNEQGNDAAAIKWQIGEDVSGLGAFRSMSNPPAFSDPDKMSSPNYAKGIDDNGGVHTNSGINNKAVSLMVDGGAFNAKTVAPLGWEKTAAIYYETSINMLASGADYSDLYYALQQACTNLIGQKSIVPDDCLQVKNALDAVEMNSQPAKNFNSHAPTCGTGQPVSFVFLDNLENGSSNWMFQAGTRQRWQVDSPYGTYVHSGIHSLFAADSPAAITDAVASIQSVLVPPKAYLQFWHAYDFETAAGSITKYYDGGVVEYSTDNGVTWQDASLLIDHNGYNGSIYSGWNNPLKGKPAFVSSSHGYISTHLNLSPLVGKMVAFRWRMGLDDLGSSLGWWIDDVSIFTCTNTLTFTARSSGAEDGWILETSETSNKGGSINTSGTSLFVGDAVGDKQYRAILSFNTAGLPDNAVIVGATLSLKKQALVGTDPFLTHQGLKFDIRKSYFGTASTLIGSDFQAPPSLMTAGGFLSKPINSWYYAVLNTDASALVNKIGLTQFRFRFAKDDNDDNGSDYLAFSSGNSSSASARPTLLIEYYVP